MVLAPISCVTAAGGVSLRSTRRRTRVAVERLSDRAGVVFEGDYLREHVTLGYAATVHSAQGVTAERSYANLGEGSSRAMLYVAMTRGRVSNEAFLYQRLDGEADHEHSKPLAGEAIHRLRVETSTLPHTVFG